MTIHWRQPARWHPVRLRNGDVRLITLILWVTATIRGLDYLTGDDSGTRGPKPGVESALVGIEGAFPLVVWGGLMLFATTLLGVGMFRAWHAPVWWGHVLLCAIYAGLCFGLLPGYLDRAWLDGIRSASGLLLPTVLHGLFWWRMGRRPIEWATNGS